MLHTFFKNFFKTRKFESIWIFSPSCQLKTINFVCINSYRWNKIMVLHFCEKLSDIFSRLYNNERSFRRDNSVSKKVHPGGIRSRSRDNTPNQFLYKSGTMGMRSERDSSFYVSQTVSLYEKKNKF